ncbi:MAG: serine/threonine protein kinase, partial [Cetobacterium sp.]
MNKYYRLLFMLFLTVSIFAEYDFPLRNPYVATIVGSSKMMTEGVPEIIPVKEFQIQMLKSQSISENMWYDKGFKFSLSKQKGEAPLIYVLSGTGSPHNSVRTKNFQKIFYNAGYHVLTVSS